MQAPVSETLREKLTRINGELRAAGRPDSFYTSLEAAWNRYGSLTERQEQALRQSFERMEARRAQDNAQVAEPMPTGRVVISGEVVSTKYQESRFGTQFKMLVKADGGWKVYGTVPSGLACCGETLRGRRVTFTAQIEPREPAFGFFSRPTNASVLNAKPGTGQQRSGQSAVAPAPAAPVQAAAVLAHEEVVKQDYRGHLVAIRGTRELGWALSIDNGPLFCADRLQQVVYRAESYNTAFAVARQLIDKDAPVVAVAKPSLADIIAKAKALEAAKEWERRDERGSGFLPARDWDTDSMVA